MSKAKWIALFSIVCALGLGAVSRSVPRAAHVAAPVALPEASVAVAPAAAPGQARVVTAAAPATPAPFTAAELLAHLGRSAALAQPIQAAQPEQAPADAAEEARAQAAMKQGIEAQSPNVQRMYYRAQVNAAPQLRAVYEQQVAALEQNGASAREIAAAQAQLDAALANIEKYRAELARLDR